ncbi:MAG: hypothetical protein J6U20_12895 [Fibrobacter sp.]|nr:hypothetical protein [Fibrobacter sp.]
MERFSILCFVIFKFKNSVFVVLSLVACCLASTVVEDSRSRFVLKDMVYESSAYTCENGKGSRFVPENAVVSEHDGVAYRTYRVALPSKEKPSVRIGKVKLVPLGAPFCDATSQKSYPLSVSEPFMRDGLWISEIVVPLFEKKGKSIALRKEFELTVEYAGGAVSGVYPGKRAVSRVLNRKSAARFGVEQGKARKALRRTAQSSLSDVRFLITLNVGDRDVASFNEDGLYAIDFDALRRALPTDRQDSIKGIPINKICLFGANPDSLSERVPGSALLTPNQIFEIPIEIHDHTSKSNLTPDGTFGPGDSIVFVGYGTSMWKRMDSEDSTYENGSMDYFHSYSPYSFYQSFSFGYKTSGNGLRLSVLPAPAGAGKSIKFLRYVRGEKDERLIDSYHGKDLEWDTRTGKEWFWTWHCRFDTTTLSSAKLKFPQTSDLLGYVDGGASYVAVSFFPYRSVYDSNAERTFDQPKNEGLSESTYTKRMNGINFSLEVNGKTYSSSTLVPGGNFRIDDVSLKPKGNLFTLTLLPNEVQYDRFDGYTVAYEWKPVADTAEWILPGAVSGVIQIPVGKDANLRLMKFRDYEPLGLLKIENGVAKDSIASGEDVRYLLYRNGVYRNNISVTAIPEHTPGALNDLAAINNKTEYLIIAPTVFGQKSYELAKFRSEGSAIATFQTTLVLAEDIYRYYKGGSPSPVAIRNYIAYAKGICPNLKYVLLVGYGHFDYRGVSQLRLPTNFIPPFEKEAAASEDFFGVTDSGRVAIYGSEGVDLAVGRLTVLSEDELNSYLKKAQEYEKVGLYDHSFWRSTLIAAADDAKNGNAVDKTKHTHGQERVAALIDSLSRQKKYRWNQKKIYLLNYKEDASGQKKDAAQQMLDALNQGALMTTYFGHASVTDWASEGLLKNSYVSRLTKTKLYTILNSFSCSTSRFDNGKPISLTHSFVMSPNVGAIAAIGALRETFANENEMFAKMLMESALFDSAVTLGDAFLVAKNMGPIASNSRFRYNTGHYVLFGEPVLMMPYSRGEIVLDQNIDTLKALDKVTLSGSVQGLDHGMIHLSLREGRYGKRLYAGYTEKETPTAKDSLDVSFDGALIYSEDVQVAGGRFSVEFVTPRKLAFGDTSAEFQAWAYSNDVKPIFRHWKEGIIIAGMSSYADSIHDETPPTVRIQSCFNEGRSSDYADGQIIELQSPACLQVVFEDSTALDYREQADEGISFEIEGWQTPFHPYPYLEQTSKRAVVRMNFTSELYPPDQYVFKAAAYDVMGNRGEKTVTVNITEEMESGLADVFNVPNPMGKKGTTFYFKNLAGNERTSSVNIFIYNQNGRLVKVLKNAVSGLTTWDGRDNHGNMLANGLYHYVVKSVVSATEEHPGKTWKKKQKLLISR